MDNNLIIRMTRENASPAGFPGLYSAQKFHRWAEAAGCLQLVERKWGKVKHCWSTLTPAGAPGIPEHGHNRATVVYYPHDHPIGTWVEGRYCPAREGNFIMFPAYADHHVDANTTDQDRITLVFTLERA